MPPVIASALTTAVEPFVRVSSAFQTWALGPRMVDGTHMAALYLVRSDFVDSLGAAPRDEPRTAVAHSQD